MPMMPRDITLDRLLWPLEIDYSKRPDTRKRQAWRRRRDVQLVYPFLTPDEQKRCDEWLAHFDEKMLAIVD